MPCDVVLEFKRGKAGGVWVRAKEHLHSASLIFSLVGRQRENWGLFGDEEL